MTLDFRGGTMAEFVAELRARQPQANIVVSDAARAIAVPSMTMRDAGIEQALQAACAVVASGEEVRAVPFHGDGEPVYSVVAEPRRGRPRVAQPSLSVFSTDALTGKRLHGVAALRIETVLSALELAMSEESAPPKIRFHSDSGLLLVRGTQQQAEVVRQVLMTLQSDLERKEVQRHSEQSQRADGADQKDHR